MTRRHKILILFLITVNLSPLWAFNYGARFNLGASMGTGSDWYKALNDAGSIGFNSAIPTAGIGIFGEMDVTPILIFTPELYYVFNRGNRMTDDNGDYIKTSSIHSIELLLPLAYDFEFDSGNKAFRVLGGFQSQYSFKLKQDIDVNETERSDIELENLSPFSIGLVIGSGIETNRNKKMAWLFDLRMIIPLSTRMRYSLPNGSENSFKTLEILVGSGIKF